LPKTKPFNPSKIFWAGNDTGPGPMYNSGDAAPVQYHFQKSVKISFIKFGL